MKASTDHTAEAIAAAMPALDATDQRIATSIHRLLRQGSPIEPEAIAAAAGVSTEEVDAKLGSWPGVFRDRGGSIVGFWGQSIAKLDPEYRLEADGMSTYGWCALDTLFIPTVVDETISVEASDPMTGETISLVVDRAGVRDVMPEGAVVSMVIPDGPFGYDVIRSFCHNVRFFASRDSGERWAAGREGAALVEIDEAFEIGQALSARIAG